MTKPLAEIVKITKKCNVCGKLKDLTEFGKTGKAFRPSCKKCWASTMRTRYWTSYAIRKDKKINFMASLDNIISNAEYLKKEINKLIANVSDKND